MKNRWLSRIAAIGGALSLAAAPSIAETHIVTASGFEFSPDTITITEGDTIMWTDLSGLSHNVVSTDCPATVASVANGDFSSGIPGAVDTYSVVFGSAGTVCYVCEPHGAIGMFGTITVEAATAPVPTMGEWGLITMSVLLLGFGAFQLKRRGTLAAVNS